MKICVAALVLLLFTTIAHAQTTEMGQGAMLYSARTMQQLKHIVDSLNLKFKACELGRTYYAVPQAQGHYFYHKGPEVVAMAKLLAHRPSFREVQAAFPHANYELALLLTQSRDRNYDDEPYLNIQGVGIGKQQSRSLSLFHSKRIDRKHLKGKWLYNYTAPTENYEGSIHGFYIATEFATQPLDDRYARMVQYVDCMVDTTTRIFTQGAAEGDAEAELGDLSQMTLAQKEALLHTLRSTMVFGECSQDQAPRIHARNIAIVAAESMHWEVFLRAHLDILNDHFVRLSDGDYAMKGRMTYVGELEALDINTLQLLLGMSFRIQNASTNHYYGSIGRLGRAIAEAQDVAAIEKQILGMIQDPALDDFNRVIMHNLFISYLLQDQNAARRAANTQRFELACRQLPAYLAKHVTVEEVYERDVD